MSTERTISPINGLEFAPEWVGTAIHFHCEPVSDHQADLFPEEWQLVENSVQLRKDTFSTGRHCARTLLNNMGHDSVALLRNSDGSIRWPDGIQGSVSHTNDWAVAGVAVEGLSEAVSLGIDLERIRPINQAVLKHIATENERKELSESVSQPWHSTALFGLKESVYKCLRPDFGSYIRFHDVEIINVASGRPQLRIVCPELIQHCGFAIIELRLAVTPEYVFSLAWRSGVTPE